jgi:hypothetical protein
MVGWLKTLLVSYTGNIVNIKVLNRKVSFNEQFASVHLLFQIRIWGPSYLSRAACPVQAAPRISGRLVIVVMHEDVQAKC